MMSAREYGQTLRKVPSCHLACVELRIMATPSAPEAIPANSTSTEVNNNSTAKVPSPQEVPM